MVTNLSPLGKISMAGYQITHTIDKKAAKAAYREHKSVAGIYAVRRAAICPLC